MSKKRIITVTASEVSPYEFEGTLEAIKTQIQSWIDEHGPDARLNWDPDNWPQYNNSPSPQFEIKIDREENDSEKFWREKNEKDQREVIKKRELAEYERLKKQFEGK